MSQANGSGGDAEGLIIIFVLLLLLVYFYKYAVFFFWIPTKIAELWIWSLFHPHYVSHLRQYVDTVTLKTLNWRDAEYVNGQVLSIWGKGWIKPIAFLQTGLAMLLTGLLWRKVRQHGMRPVKDVRELANLQQAQFPWGHYWLNQPRERETVRRPHEVFADLQVRAVLPILKKQLGRKNIAFDQLDPRLQALYRAFYLQEQGRIEEAQATLKLLAIGTTPSPAAGAEENWDRRMRKFHFERTCFIDALFSARANNLLPPSWFNWLKIENRALWMALNTTPPYREVVKPFRAASEALGPLAWWVAVKSYPTGEHLDAELEAAFQPVLGTLQEAVSEVDYEKGNA